MKKLMIVLVALLALRLAGRALKGQMQTAAALWVLAGLASLDLNGGANTAKTRSVENRLNALVPVVFPNTGGTINGAVTTNGNNTVNGNQTVTGNHTVGGQALVGGASGSATLEVAGNGHVTSALEVDGNHTVGGQLSVTGSATVEITPGTHIGGAMQVDGNTTLSGNLNGGPVVVGGQSISGWPISAGANIGTVTGSNVFITSGFVNALNSLANALTSSGLA